VTASLATVVILLFGLLASGFWIALSLLVTAGVGLELFTRLPVDRIMAQALWNSLNSWSLAALPMFIFLGEMILRTRMSRLLFEGLIPWVQFVPGRLLHINVVGSALFAAVSGSSPATAATIGKITLAQLRERGYDRSLSYGSLAGAGTLGLLIPPSIVLIVYGVLAEVSIGRLFVAGIVPGLLLATLFSLYIIVRVALDPRLGPDETERFSWRERLVALAKLSPVALLIVFILGSIYLGFATPSEAAAIGVVLSVIVAAALGDLSWKTFLEAVRGTLNTTAMIGFIIAGASFLSVAMGYLRLPATIARQIAVWGLEPYVLIAILTLFYIVLGFFLDGISIIVMTLPISLPLIVQAGFSPLWFGIFLTVVIEAGQITPPVGFNLFVIQGLTEEPVERVALAALPFFVLLLLGVLLLTLVPSLVTWLPGFM
jgi:C4-dicarboxylate transporter DctM subunit